MTIHQIINVLERAHENGSTVRVINVNYDSVIGKVLSLRLAEVELSGAACRYENILTVEVWRTTTNKEKLAAIHAHCWDWQIDKSGGAFRVDKLGIIHIKPLPNKISMTKKIVSALYNTPQHKITNENINVRQLMRKPKRELIQEYINAQKIISDRIEQR